jgi:tetratricopeptide (TPR) repeat protein
MRATLAALAASLLLVPGCGDKALNASIEEMNEGVALSASGQYAAAERHFEKAASLAEHNHTAWYNLGQVRAQQKKWDTAVDAFSNAVRHRGSDAMYHYYLGRSHWEAESRNLSNAAQHLEKAVELNDRLFKAYYYLGKAYEAQDRPKEAAQAWTRSASLAPSFGRPFNELGQLYIKWDRLDEAQTVLEQGLQRVIDSQELSDIYYHLGLAFEKKSRHKEAADAYSKSLEQRADNIDARRQRGFVYAQLGDRAKAREDLEQFVKAGGGGNAFHVQAANDRLMRLLTE